MCYSRILAGYCPRVFKNGPAKYIFQWDRAKDTDLYLSESEGYIKIIIDRFLPPDHWDWSKRWLEVVQPALRYYIYVSLDTAQREIYFKGRLLAEMLHEAPSDIQMRK